MNRHGGKLVPMDDPPPEDVNPMTPATQPDYGGQSVHEPETPATPNYSEFNVGAGANSTAALNEPPRDEADESHDSEPPHLEEENPRSPSPTPTKPVTRSRGRRVDGAFPGRSADSLPPPPVDDENSLFYILRFNKSSLNTVVNTWVEEYKTHRDVALVRLMQFFINSSGCPGKVTPDMVQMDYTLVIGKMFQEFDKKNGEYPLIMSGHTWEKFRGTFCEFIHTLVKMCQYSIIYDQYLMNNIISLLTGLSESPVRPFRHTATLAVMKLMTALVDVAVLNSSNCDNCRRQYEAERVKRASKGLEELVAKRKELEKNIEKIKDMLSYMFNSVFVHRYIDTVPEIRSITMVEIGSWMKKFPVHFLDDLRLKYIGWTLYDKVGEVRLRCLQALTPLYLCDYLRGKLELFTYKFKERILSMSLDKEIDVAVHAVKLVTAIYKMYPDALTGKDCEKVYDLVYSTWRGVATAAGEFLNVRLFQPPATPPPPVRTRGGKLRQPSTPLVRDLVHFFIESELPEHGPYLVDSLIESNPMMKDWECMTDLLLEEPGPGEEALDNIQESSLIVLMVSCVRQASTGKPPMGRGPARPWNHAKVVSVDRAKMTAHFITTLPALLEKFGADPKKLTNLVSIPQYMDFELYTTQRQKAKLTLLLNKIRDIVQVQTDAEALETCGRTLEALCGVGDLCNVARAIIIDMCVNPYKEAIGEFRTLIASGETPDADKLFNVVNSLHKLSIMYKCHNLNDTNIWDSLYTDLPKCFEQNPTQMPPQALVSVVRACFFSVVWSLNALEELIAGSAPTGGGRARRGAVAAETTVLRLRVFAYGNICSIILDAGITPELKEEAYTSLCDLILVCAELPGEGPAGARAAALRALALDPEPSLFDKLNRFIQEFVFVHHNYDSEEERIEELHKKRNFLAAYCKLIVYNLAPIHCAADVFKHYIKSYNEYGELIKVTLNKTQELDKLNCALTMQLAMVTVFTELLRDHPALHRHLPAFQELKELAKRFSVVFGPDAVKNRLAVTSLHRAGILFALVQEPPAPSLHLLFLEPLAEFSANLLDQDKRQVLKFLDSRIAQTHSVSCGEEWQSFLQYRNTLLPEPEDEGPPSDGDQYEEEEGEEDAESHQEQPGSSRRRVRLPVRRRRTSAASTHPSPPPPPPSSASATSTPASPPPPPPTSAAATPTSPTASAAATPASPPPPPSTSATAAPASPPRPPPTAAATPAPPPPSTSATATPASPPPPPSTSATAAPASPPRPHPTAAATPAPPPPSTSATATPASPPPPPSTSATAAPASPPRPPPTAAATPAPPPPSTSATATPASPPPPPSTSATAAPASPPRPHPTAAATPAPPPPSTSATATPASPPPPPSTSATATPASPPPPPPTSATATPASPPPPPSTSATATPASPPPPPPTSATATPASPPPPPSTSPPPPTSATATPASPPPPPSTSPPPPTSATATPASPPPPPSTSPPPPTSATATPASPPPPPSTSATATPASPPPLTPTSAAATRPSPSPPTSAFTASTRPSTPRPCHVAPAPAPAPDSSREHSCSELTDSTTPKPSTSFS